MSKSLTFLGKGPTRLNADAPYFKRERSAAAGIGANRLVMVQLVCACQDRVALSSLDLHLDSARRPEGLGLYDFAPGMLAKIKRSSLG
jgi:hypothetical protein